jgi:hypothetical protein
MHDSSLSKSLVSLWPKFDLCEFFITPSGPYYSLRSFLLETNGSTKVDVFGLHFEPNTSTLVDPFVSCKKVRREYKKMLTF